MSRFRLQVLFVGDDDLYVVRRSGVIVRFHEVERLLGGVHGFLLSFQRFGIVLQRAKRVRDLLERGENGLFVRPKCLVARVDGGLSARTTAYPRERRAR